MNPKRKVTIIVSILTVILLMLLFGNGNSSETTEIERGDYYDKIYITGKVKSEKDVSLSFDTSGKVFSIYKNKGDSVFKGEKILSLESTEEEALYREQLAIVQQSEVTLKGLLSGSGVYEDELKKTSVLKADDSFNVAKNKMIIVLENTMNSVRTSIKNDIDENWFSVVTTDRTVLKGVSIPFSLRDEIITLRKDVIKILSNWKSYDIAPDIETDELKDRLEVIQEDLKVINSLVYKLSEATTSTSKSQDEGLENAKTRISGNIEAFLLAIDNLNTVEASLRSAVAEYEFSSSSYSENVQKQTLDLVSKKERLGILKKNYEDTVLKSPFNGFIGDIFVEVGENVSPNLQVARVLSEGRKLIVAEVSELDSINVKHRGNMKAYIETLDRDVRVNLLRLVPGEQSIGLSSIYQVEFEILEDERDFEIKSGMSAEIELVKEMYLNSFAVSPLAINRKDGRTYVTLAKRSGREKDIDVKIVGEIFGKTIIEGDIRAGDNVLVTQKQGK